MKQNTNGIASWVSRRKILLLCVLLILTVLFFVVREKYFYRADALQAISITTKRLKERLGVSVKKTKTSLWSYFGFNEAQTQLPTNVWDRWIMMNPQLTSIGDIYNKCDNKTRKKVGKVVLEPVKGQGIRIMSYVNQTYDFEITEATSHMKVFYQGDVLYEKDYDMCEQAKELDTPHTCPFPAGQEIVIRDAATLPSYIPKGKYKIEASVKNHDGTFIGCTFAEFKTGEDEIKS